MLLCLSPSAIITVSQWNGIHTLQHRNTSRHSSTAFSPGTNRTGWLVQWFEWPGKSQFILLNISGKSVTHDLYPEVAGSNTILSYTVKTACKGKSKRPKLVPSKKVQFNTSTWIPYPRECKDFPLNTGYRYSKVPFKTGFISFKITRWLKKILLIPNQECVKSISSQTIEKNLWGFRHFYPPSDKSLFIQ